VSAERGEAAEPSIPRRLSHYLSRDRLLEALDAAATDRPVVVRAQGGAGKTTLLVDWLRRRTDDIPVVWVALDESTRTREGFWRRVVTAMVTREALPADGAGGEILSGGVDPARVPALLLDEIDALPRRLRLVLDDAHLIDLATERDLIWMLERSTRMQLLVTTRRRLRLESAREAVRLEPVILTERQLAFTLDETIAIVDSARAELSEHDAATIHRATGGHPLATRVTIATLSEADGIAPLEHSDVVARVAAHATEDLLPVFADDERRRIALLIALTPAADHALAVRLSGRDDVDDVLHEFERDGFGEFTQVRREALFTFHSLVRATLQWEAERGLQASVVTESRRIAAQHLATTGRPMDALRLFARVGDTRAMGMIVAQNYSDVIDHHQTEIRELIEGIDPAVLRQDGLLTIVLSIVMSENEPLPSPRLLELVNGALELLERARNTAEGVELFFALLCIFAGLRTSRRYGEAALAGAELLAHADTLSPAQREAVAPVLAAATTQVLVTNLLIGRFDTALELGQGLSNDAHPWRQQHRLSLLAYIQSVRGDMVGARHFGAAVSGARAERWRATVPGIGWHVADSLGRLEGGDHEGALELISSLDSRLGVVEQWPYLLWAKGLIRLAADDAELGVDELASAVRRNRSRIAAPFALDLLGALQSDLFLAAGSPERAAKALSVRSATAAPVVLARTRLRWATGDLGEIGAALAPLLWGDSATPRQQAEAFLLQAVTQLRLGFDAEATLSGRRAFRILDEHGMRVPLLFAARAELRTVAAALSPDRVADVNAMPDPFGGALTPVALTRRERLVLGELATSANLETIADRQFISGNTVKTHVQAIYRKLGVSSRADAVASGRRRGLI
jgi:LuxR family maltose regulon positive regulatory protein